MAKSLRQLMFDEIKDLEDCCNEYSRSFNKTFHEWLNSLSDKDFLDTYLTLRDKLDGI